MPDHIAHMCDEWGIYVPEGVSTALYQEVYAPMLVGRCLCCKAPLAGNTMAVVTKHGVTMLFCSGACLSDYNVMGYLSEKYDDIKDSVEFRGQADG